MVQRPTLSHLSWFEGEGDRVREKGEGLEVSLPEVDSPPPSQEREGHRGEAGRLSRHEEALLLFALVTLGIRAIKLDIAKEHV